MYELVLSYMLVIYVQAVLGSNYGSYSNKITFCSK